MTRIETIFGGLLAAGILAVFAFVFFGSSESRTTASPIVSANSEAPRVLARTSSRATLNGLLSDDPDDYVAPTTACECYYMGYDIIRERLGADSDIFIGQLQTCYDNVGSTGAAAMEDGASDAANEPRPARRSCRAADYR